jgi:hypothetical protein
MFAKPIKQLLFVCKGYPWQPAFLSSTPSSWLLPRPKPTEVLERNCVFDTIHEHLRSCVVSAPHCRCE